jgi:hypothetical protein
MQTIFQEGVTGVWFDLANNEHIPCGISKQIYLENDGLHVTDSGQNVTITFAISRKKLIGLGLALIFAACLDLGGMLFRKGQSAQLGQGRIDDNDITAVECGAPFARQKICARDKEISGAGFVTPTSLHRQQQLAQR